MDRLSELYFAIIENDLKFVSDYIKEGSEINNRIIGKYSLLHIAVKHGNKRVTKLLVDGGIDLESCDHSMSTPIHLSVRWPRTDMLKILIEAKADVNAEDLNGDTPLHKAVEYRRSNLYYNGKNATGPPCFEKIDLLIKVGADVNYFNENFQTPFTRYLSLLKNFKNKDVDGAKKCLRLFLERADVNLTDIKNRNVLALALETDIYCSPKLVEYGKVIYQHIAKLKSLDFDFDPKIIDYDLCKRGQFNYERYYEVCTNELVVMKIKKVVDSVSFFDLLVANEEELSKYVGSKVLLTNFFETNLEFKFPSYGGLLKHRVWGAIDRRLAATLSDLVPILHSTPGIIHDILFALSDEDKIELC